MYDEKTHIVIPKWAWYGTLILAGYGVASAIIDVITQIA